MNNITIWNNDKNEIPIIVSIPHSGTYIPRIMKKNLINNIVLANMDWYLPSLYSFLKDLKITTIINNVSRYVIDVNRELSNNSNDSFVHNYVYTKTTFNNPMYKEKLKDEEIKSRILKYYTPYHITLKKLLDDKLSNFNKVFLIDLHSFGKDIVSDIVLGNKNGQTINEEFTMFIKNILNNLDFKVDLNIPYSGGYIVKKYSTENVNTLQIELNYKKYIDNKTFSNEDFPKVNQILFTETQEKLKYLFENIISFLSINI